jgi:chemotaxis protein methyltransferase CheR
MNRLPQLSDDEFRQIQKVVYDAAGLAVAETGRTLLSSRVRKRLRTAELESFRDYVRRLTRDPDELSALLDAVCSKETSFFRTPSHFEWFMTTFFAEHTLLARRRAGLSPSDKELRIWSAACSSGEEAYSLAIILAYNEALLSHLDIKLFASDLSTTVIQYAKEGLYSSKDVAKLDAASQRFFEPDGPDMRVKPRVRSLIQFSVHNLMQPAPHRNLDCLFLRNVLIYFDTRSKETVLRNVVDAIRPGGYLVVGPSEGVFHIPEGLERVQSFLFRRTA